MGLDEKTQFPVEVPEPFITDDDTEQWADRYQSVREEQIKIYDEEEKMFNEVFIEII